MANGSVAVNSTVRLVVKTDKNNLTTGLKTQGGPVSYYLRKIGNLFHEFVNGAWNCNVRVALTCVSATGTVTFSSLANNDTVTVNGRVYTAKTSGATGLQQFNLGASDAAAAVNFQTIVNADTSSLVANVVAASSGGSGVTTITCLVPGNIGNQCTLAISAHGSVSAANLAGGSEAAANSIYAKGL